MPYKMEYSHKANAYVVIKQGSEKIMGKHSTKAEAEKQLRALYANEPKSKRG